MNQKPFPISHSGVSSVAETAQAMGNAGADKPASDGRASNLSPAMVSDKADLHEDGTPPVLCGNGSLKVPQDVRPLAVTPSPDSDLPQVAMVYLRRCLWCRDRIGTPSLFVNGQWLPQPPCFTPKPGVCFTDGICADCLKLEKAKLN